MTDMAEHTWRQENLDLSGQLTESQREVEKLEQQIKELKSTNKILNDSTFCRSDFATRPIYSYDTIDKEPVGRDDLWAITTKELNGMEELREELRIGVGEMIPDGWEFDTADFSIRGKPGRVTLRRDKKREEWWFSLDESEREKTDLYVCGKGMSIKEATENAISRIQREE